MKGRENTKKLRRSCGDTNTKSRENCSNPGSYRQIALTSNIGKEIEKM